MSGSAHSSESDRLTVPQARPSAAGTSEGTTRARHYPGLPETASFQPPGSTPGPTSSPRTDAPEVPAALVDHPRYRIVRWLGSGGMGTVYAAEHRLMGRLVALKVINHHLVDDPRMVEHFRREVRAAARLNHPNIVHAYDAEQAGDTHFLVMEYVDGVDLAQVVRRQGRLPVAQACDHARQAAQGLQHAFEKGMVHRDIKPHNLMLSTQGQVKILDFGLARYVSEAAPEPAAPGTGPGSYLAMGTADYVAPEVVWDARHADVRADVYSLGCTLYRFLTGQVPFPEGGATEKIRAHLEAAPRPLVELRPDVPAELARVVERMMAREPGLRYQTPAEVADALAPFTRVAAQHLLVVDDDAVMREALRRLLEPEGFTVSTAADGREALAVVRGPTPPGLILLDLVMPVMDGWQLLQELRGDPALAAIPVIIVSAADPQQTRAAVLGAADYLQKPVALEELATRLAARRSGASAA